MNPNEFAKCLLYGPTLSDKLISPKTIKPFESLTPFTITTPPESPAREEKIKISSKRIKFPKAANLASPLNTAKALNFFANHELLAIEMMACALLMFPHDNNELLAVKNSFIQTIKDEQKHLSLYIKRINELGYEFGQFPLNGFFWEKIHSIKTPQAFLATMGLTFENANLDFALYYSNIFKELGDHKTAKILEIIYQDEISHVARSVKHLNAWKGDQTLWNYYSQILPYPLTPARAKGPIFDINSRVKAKLDHHFIQHLQTYDDQYEITKRRQWKQAK